MFSLSFQAKMVNGLGLKWSYAIGMFVFAVSMLLSVFFPTAWVVCVCNAVSGIGKSRVPSHCTSSYQGIILTFQAHLLLHMFHWPWWPCTSLTRTFFTPTWRPDTAQLSICQSWTVDCTSRKSSFQWSQGRWWNRRGWTRCTWSFHRFVVFQLLTHASNSRIPSRPPLQHQTEA